MKTKIKAETVAKIKTKVIAKPKVSTKAKIKTTITPKTKIKKQIPKKVEKVSTLLGTTIIIIMAITAGMFVWLVKKDDFKEIENQARNSCQVEKTANLQQVKKQEIPGQQNVETMPWQVYRNEQLGFELQYPKDWTFDFNLSIFTPNLQENCGPNMTEENSKPTCLDNISFEILDNKSSLKLTEFWKKEYGWENGIHYKDLKGYEIGEIIAYTITTISAYDGTENKALWVPLDGKFFSLKGSYLSENENSILNRMISTFKLIN